MDKYIYNEKKGYFIGLPARDIDADEWNELPEELTKPALKLGIYILKKEKTEVKHGA